MTWRPRRLVAAAAAIVPLLCSAARTDIPVQLRFDGQPLEPAAKPDFTCFSSTLDRWISCRLRKADGPGAYMLGTLDPGQYRMHVSIDENPANPRRYPGDYEAQLAFEVTATGPERLTVDLARLIHLRGPGDNARSLPGMLRGCTGQPQFETPRLSWGPSATVDFAWDAVVPNAEYRYTLAARPCGQAGAGRDVASGQTAATTIALSLPPSVDGEYYVFRVEAWKNEHLIGDLHPRLGRPLLELSLPRAEREPPALELPGGGRRAGDPPRGRAATGSFGSRRSWTGRARSWAPVRPAGAERLGVAYRA